MSIHHVATTASTNDDLAAMARAGAAEGTWLYADTQQGGRGRHGRSWVSPSGNLYASTLVRLRPDDPAPHTLAMVAAVALDELLQAYVPSERLTIKWPNDLLVDGAKISGILLERVDDSVVVGIGVNLARHPTDIDRLATSLAALGLASPDPADFIVDLASGFARCLAIWRGEGLAAILRRWQARSHVHGTALSVGSGAHRTDGLYDGVDADGALRLRLADGRVHIVHAGDVFLL